MSNVAPPSSATQVQTEDDEVTNTRRARLWEDTIVLALRDVQWRAAWSKRDATRGQQPKLCIPKGIVKMDGTSESHLGDVALKADDHRFFLIEVKSTMHRVKDEWGNGGLNAKKLYQRLALTVDTAKRQTDTGGLETAMLELSLRGHWIAFWHPGLLTGNVRPGFIELQPYLQAVIDNRDPESVAFDGVITNLPLPHVHAYLPSDPTHLRYYMEVFDLEDHQFLVGYIDPMIANKARQAVGAVGLNREEFQVYVNYLTGGRAENPAGTPGEPINAVVQTVRDGFFQMVTDTTQLANVLDPDFEFTPELEARLRRLRARQDREASDAARREQAALDIQQAGIRRPRRMR